MIVYNSKDVLEASIERIKYVFDNFENIIVSVSSGKDSSVLYYLALDEAIKRNRKIKVFFLDQEAEYEGSIVILRRMMNHSNVIPLWYQVPLQMTNATSYDECFLNAWGEGEKWMREKEDIAIKKIDTKYPNRFYKFFDWFEKQQTEKTAQLIGLRSKESLNRFRSVTSNPGYKKIPWSTKTKNPLSFKFYPIYDWCFGDIWKYINDNNIPYNDVYDKMYCLLGKKLNDIRISNLIHEKSFKCLHELQEIEPETYDKLIKRINGIHTAAIYCNEKTIYSNEKLPENFNSWKEYRDFLLETSNIAIKFKEKFIKRFSMQSDSEEIYKQQAKQVLLNDHDNTFHVIDQEEKKKKLKEKWFNIL